MIVAYAPGAGLGHLTRVHAAVHTLRLAGPLVVVTDSRFATDPRVARGATVVPIERPLTAPGTARDALGHAIGEHRPSLVLLDATPAGPAGELDAGVVPPDTATLHLARAVRWSRYRPLLPARPPHLDRVVPVEALPAEQARWLADHAAEVEAVRALVDPPERPRRPDGTAVDPAEVAGAWLVVHAGPPDELDDLVAYAREQAALERRSPRIVVIAPGAERGAAEAGTEGLDVYPAWPLFAASARVITAGGANSVRQLVPTDVAHRVLPFERRLDDQHARARRVR